MTVSSDHRTHWLNWLPVNVQTFSVVRVKSLFPHVRPLRSVRAENIAGEQLVADIGQFG